MAKGKPDDKILTQLRELIEQARKGNAGLIVISVATAEQIVKRFEEKT